MGGYGSGRWGWSHSKKIQVEQCLQLPIKTIYRSLAPGYWGSVQWSIGDRATNSIRYRVEGDEQPRAVWFVYTQTNRVTGQKTDFDYQVPLTTTPLPWGGVRYWFVCTLSKNEVYCGRRVGVIFLPPGYQYFGCRHCYELTYRSCQEQHQLDSFYDSFALGLQDDYPGCTGRDIKSLLEGRLTTNMSRIRTDKFIRDWQCFDLHAQHLTPEQLCEKSGLSLDDLALLESARLLVPDLKDGRYRPKLAGWGQKLAYLLHEGWSLAEIKRWAKDRWSTPNPRRWPPDHEQWR